MEYKRERPGPKSQYSDAFKRKVVEEILSGSIHPGGAVRKYGIAHSGTVFAWKKWYLKNHDIVPKQEPMGEDKTTPPDPAEHAQIKALQEALKLAELKVAALQTMIDIAEQHYKIPIRKNSGTKQQEQ
jgi:transposase-like protein